MDAKLTIYGGGPIDTVLHPLVALAMLVTIALIFLLPRRYVVVPFLLTVFLVPFGQMVVLGGIHFMVYRIIVIFGLIRVLLAKLSSKKEWSIPGGVNGIDQVFAWCAFFSALNCVLLWMETQALINKLGVLLDALGGYFLLRFLIRNEEDICRVIKVFAVVTTLVALVMINEQLTRRNIFETLGGLHPVEVRAGQVRSHGVFQHSILAGTFGATVLPLFAGLWKYRESRVIAVVGAISAVVMAVTSNSSTPLLALFSGIAALCLWPLRRRMRIVRWGLVITLVALHLIMKAPVWALIGRIDLTGSSSGYMRYMLVDNFIRHFSDWWLLGTKDFGNWGWDMWDQANQYVAYGNTGGLVTLVLFIAIIWRSFAELGKARKRVAGSTRQEWFLWALGAALFSHVMAYFGVSYFDQTEVAWFALLVIISTAVYRAQQSPALQVGTVAELTHATSLEPGLQPLSHTGYRHIS